MKDCLIWQRSRTKAGYGNFRKDTVYYLAHRVMWEAWSGQKIPKGMYVMHSCDTPACINPHHLSVGTPQENARDAMGKGRAPARGQYCQREHEQTADNVYTDPRGYGECRTCRRSNRRRAYLKGRTDAKNKIRTAQV